MLDSLFIEFDYTRTQPLMSVKKSLALFSFILTCFFGFGQNCTTVYGPSGEPAEGLTYYLCDTPTVVTLDATSTQGTATAYQWSGSGNTNATETVSALGTYTVTVSAGGNPNACILDFQVVTPPIYSIDLGIDTSICFGDTIVASVPDTFVTYSWNTGSPENQINITDSGQYSITITDSLGCIKTDTLVVDTLTPPTVDLGTNQTLCFGDTTTLDAGAGATSYLWNTGAATQTIDVITGALDTFSVEVVNAVGCNAFDTVTVDSFSLPEPEITGNDTVCLGLTSQMSLINTYSSYLWEDGSAAATTNYTAPTDTIWVEVTDNNGCVGTDTFSLAAYTPDTVQLGADTSFCAGDSIILSAGAGFSSYSWSNFTGNQMLTISSPGTYSVTVSDANGCLTSDTIVVGQNALPTPNLGPDLEYCQGSPLSQVIDVGTAFDSHLWMDGTVTSFNTLTNQDSLVWIEVIDSNTCVGTDTLFVIRNNLPNVNIGNFDTICQGGAQNLNPGNGGGSFASFSWSTGDVSQTIPATVAGDYSVTVTDTNGCISSDTTNVFVNPLPVPNLGADTGICQGSNFNITLDPGSFDSYNWSNTATTPTITVTNPGYGTYAVTVTDTNGCNNIDNITIFQYNLPNPSLGPDTNYCSDIGFTLVLSPGNYEDYLWSDASENAILLIDTAGTYSVTVTDVNGCEQSDAIDVGENAAPMVNLGADLLFCEDELINEIFDAGSMTGPGMSFEWSTGSSVQQIIVTQTGDYEVTVTDNSTGCDSEDDVEVTYFPRANPDLGVNDIICQGEILSLDPDVDLSGYTYIWNTGATTPTIDIDAPGTYWVRLDSENGTCVNLTDTIELTQGVLPVIELGEDLRQCEGQTVIFNDDASPQPSVSYRWQDNEESYRYEVTESGLYTLTATNKCGSVIDNVRIIFDDCFNVWVPDAFTPNGDGKNDKFFAKSDQEFFEFNMWVFDRYGHVVWKTNNPFQTWDGTVNGEEAPSGQYVWKMDYIKAYDRTFDRKEDMGRVILIR